MDTAQGRSRRTTKVAWYKANVIKHTRLDDFHSRLNIKNQRTYQTYRKLHIITYLNNILTQIRIMIQNAPWNGRALIINLNDFGGNVPDIFLGILRAASSSGSCTLSLYLLCASRESCNNPWSTRKRAVQPPPPPILLKEEFDNSNGVWLRKLWDILLGESCRIHSGIKFHSWVVGLNATAAQTVK